MKRRDFVSALLLVSPSAFAGALPFTARAINKSTIIVGDNNSIQNITNTNLQLPSSKVTLDVGLASSEDNAVEKLLGVDGSPSFEYAITQQGIFAEVAPADSYLSAYFSGRKVEALVYGYYESPTFSVMPPTFDVRILNNSDRSVTVKEIALEVKTSRTEHKPIVIFISAANEFGKLRLINEGNNKIDEIAFEFDLYLSSDKLGSASPISSGHRIELKNISDVATLDFRQLLGNSGVDVTFLGKEFEKENPAYPRDKPKKFKAALGPFVYSEKSEEGKRFSINDTIDSWRDLQFQAYVSGRFKAISLYKGEQYTSKGEFGGAIPLTPPEGLGAGLETLEAFQVRLKSIGNDYLVRMPVSSYLKPFEAERFLFRVHSNQTSRHEFTVRVQLNDDEFLSSKPFKLFLFTPRSSVANSG